jgi:hypothetical protein
MRVRPMAFAVALAALAQSASLPAAELAAELAAEVMQGLDGLQARPSYLWELINLNDPGRTRPPGKELPREAVRRVEQPDEVSAPAESNLSGGIQEIHGLKSADGSHSARVRHFLGGSAVAVHLPGQPPKARRADHWLSRDALARIAPHGGAARQFLTEEDRWVLAAIIATSQRRPDELLPGLLQDAEGHRRDGEWIVVDLQPARIREWWSDGAGRRHVALSSCRGTAALKLRSGQLVECRLQFEYELDPTPRHAHRTNQLDLLYRFLDGESKGELARAELAAALASAR